MDKGFVRLYRKLVDWQWFTFPRHLQIFIYLIIMASWQDKKVGRDNVSRGTLNTSIRKLSESFNCTHKVIEKVLKDLEETGEIQTGKSNKGTIVTITNYDYYQDGAEKKRGGVSNRDTPKDTQTDTPKDTQTDTQNNVSVSDKDTQTDTPKDTQTDTPIYIQSLKKKNIKEEVEELKNEKSTTTQSKNDFFKKIKSENVAEYLKAQNDMWRENMMVSLHIGKNDSLLDRLIDSFQQELISAGSTEKDENDLRRHFLSYARKALKNDDAFKTAKAKVERMADASAYGIAEKDYNDNWN